jgi:hypothetical protein
MNHSKERFQDTKGVIRSHQSKKDTQYNGQKKRTQQGHSMIYKTLHTLIAQVQSPRWFMCKWV